MRRLLVVLVVTALSLGAAAAYAQEDDTAAPPAEERADGPSLQMREQPAEACDPSVSRLRYLEVRGAGFDAWALQRLTSSLVDVDGTPLMSWGSVWVSPMGQLTLEVNLCADPFSGRDALAPGTYAVLVSPRDGQPIASTTLEIAPLPEAPEDTTATADAQ